MHRAAELFKVFAEGYTLGRLVFRPLILAMGELVA